MFAAEDFALFSCGYLGIYFCCCDRTVAKQFLDIADIHIGFQQKGSEGVTKHMRRDVLLNFSLPRVLINHISHRLL